MSKNNEQKAYEHLRKGVKELIWAAANLRAYYNLTKPDSEETITDDPRQLNLFDNDTDQR